jgi:hypothetical protein
MTSPIEDIFEKIFGYVPPKRGTAFERLAAIASYMLEKKGQVEHDARVRGKFSETLYQIDVLHSAEGGTKMGEAKDYSEQHEKVGRGDLQKLSGALPDLDSINEGIFFSATGFTGPAKKYAAVASNLTGGKPISLYELRPSTKLDEKGFLKTIVVNMRAWLPLPSQAKWSACLTESGEKALKALLKDGEKSRTFNVTIDGFWNHAGSKVLPLDLTSCGLVDTTTNKQCACFLLKNHFIKVEGALVEIRGLEYEIPFNCHEWEMKITDDSEQRFVMLDGKGKVLMFFPDKQLRNFSFDESGVLAPQSHKSK